MHDGVVTCGLDESVGEVREKIASSPYGFGVATTSAGIVLGRVRGSVLDCDPALRIDEVIALMPENALLVLRSTVYPGVTKLVYERLQAEHTSNEVRAGLAKLPDRPRMALVLRYFADMSYAEIAETLDVRRAFVGVLLLRARHQLRDVLTEQRGAQGTSAGRSS